MALMVGLGEVLWDIFPDGKRLLGGAPANFAFHAQQLGHEALIISRVGADELGQAILRDLKSHGLRIDAIQLDGTDPTGTVHVTQVDDGTHGFLITPNVAWDRLIATRELVQLIEEADVVCFGTLAQRSKASRSAIDLLLTRATGMTIFDLNLRQEYWSRDVIETGLRHSHVVKLNDDERAVLQQLNLVSGDDGDKVAWCRALMTKYDVACLALTRGRDGAMLVTSDECVDEPGIDVTVADSVGAGDAFTAGMADALLANRPLRAVAEFANRLGAYVASQPGATPTLPAEVRQTRDEGCPRS
jgi:fructokinase